MSRLREPPPGLAVVKVGGSLYDNPQLGPGLRAYLEGLDASQILVVAGGGIFADAVREVSHWQNLGEEKSHELALIAAHTGMHFIRDRLGITEGGWTTAVEWWTMFAGQRVNCLGPAVFLMQYENLFGQVPHTWELTTDSIAALAAAVGKARLILLKSIDIPPGISWEQAAARGWVDGCFPEIASRSGIHVETMNFRRCLDNRADASTAELNWQPKS